MVHDFSTDPRFTELPLRFQEELKDKPPTGDLGEDGGTWHEVQFKLGGIMVQCAVVNRRWVVLSKHEVDNLIYIIKVFPPTTGEL